MEVRPDYANMPSTMWYETWITREPLDGSKFISLNDRLSPDDLSRLIEEKIGNASYMVINTKAASYEEIDRIRKLYSERFFPFDTSPDKKHPYFLGKGIADEIQLIIAEHLLEEFGKEFRVIHREPSDTREHQLNRIGIQKNTWYDITEYVNICKQAAVKY